MTVQRATHHSIETTTLADLLERILDKGIVIAGDIKVNLCDVELLTVQIRLVICSVDKASEMGMDWWVNNPVFMRHADHTPDTDRFAAMEQRLAGLETAATKGPSVQR